jgi:thiamine biosynthesis lipoprotein
MSATAGVLVLACLAGAAAPAQEGAATDEVRRHEGGVMGTELVVEVVGPDGEALERALAAAVAELERVEDLMTDWRPSELTRLNDAAGTGPHAVPPELARLVARGLEVARLSGGAFDPTYAGVGRLWDFKQQPPVIPDAEQLRAGLALVGHDRVRVDLEAGTVELPAGMRLGLGGIAKGYGVDRAMAVLMEHGVERALVNAGGDLKALGRGPDGPWEIAVRHPRDRERVLAVLPVVNTCVVTSGDYERFFEHEGRRYHHIIDPRTGYPSEGCTSATVVAPDAAAADALATALCVLGPERGLELIESLDRVEALVVDMQGQVRVSSGLERAVVAPGAAGR